MFWNVTYRHIIICGEVARRLLNCWEYCIRNRAGEIQAAGASAGGHIGGDKWQHVGCARQPRSAGFETTFGGNWASKNIIYSENDDYIKLLTKLNT